MPRKKTNEEFLKELQEKFQDEYTPLENYKGNSTKINILHRDCNEIIHVRPKDILLEKSKCGICSGNKKLSYEEIVLFIEENSECKLISTEVKNTLSHITLECKCGENFITQFSQFKHEDKRSCNKCSYGERNEKLKKSFEAVKEEIEAREGYILLDSKYVNSNTPLTIKCPVGHTFKKRLNDFRIKIPCTKCSNIEKGKASRLEYDEIKKNIEVDGYTLYSDEYINNRNKLDIKCPEGHLFNMRYGDFLYNEQRCPICYKENRRKNATSSLFLWLRENMTEWKIKSMQNCGYKCVITGMPMEVVHHVYSFNLIAKETISNLNMPIHQNISLYSDKELELMVEECLKLHWKYGLGVCLTKEIHMMYHSQYGHINNHVQFEEFKHSMLEKEII